ncbi:MAG: GNAT family N-acetyltransferase [Acidimicrobiia bacterium]|nr:GNAT family N-acetyltransferase [Acidimicrobiia bacterium]
MTSERRANRPDDDAALDGVVDLAPNAEVWAAGLLAAAFHDDPFMSWLLPQPTSRAHRARRLFSWEVVHARRCGRSLVADDGAGCALWFAPGQWRSRGLDAAREMVVGAGSVPPNRWRAAVSGMGRVERAHPREPHWYLATVGTDPARRGTGAGRKLIHAGLALADRDGVGAYLESSNVVNLPYYERFGFAVTEEITLPDGPTLWGMWRDPTPV